MRHLTDLNELIERIPDSYVRSYMEEVLAAYHAGCYRASIITTWCVICADIIRKIKKLRDNGDEEAKKMFNTLSSAIESWNKDEKKGKLTNFEKGILDDAENLRLFTKIESKHLKQIQLDRNLYAHSTNQSEGEHYDVSPERARTAIVEACEYLLLHGPKRGKALIDTVIEEIKEYSDFPLDREKIRRYWSSKDYLENASEPILRNLYAEMCKQAFLSKAAEVGKWSCLLEFCYHRIQCIESDGEIKQLVNDGLSAKEKTKMIRIADIISWAPSFRKLLNKESERLLDKLKKDSIKDFINSTSYDMAKETGEFIEKFFGGISEQELSRILDGSLKNEVSGYYQILGAMGIEPILIKLYEKTEYYQDLWSKFINELEKINENLLPGLKQRIKKADKSS